MKTRIAVLLSMLVGLAIGPMARAPASSHTPPVNLRLG